MVNAQKIQKIGGQEQQKIGGQEQLDKGNVELRFEEQGRPGAVSWQCLAKGPASVPRFRANVANQTFQVV
jgi:hypothetical protein